MMTGHQDLWEAAGSARTAGMAAATKHAGEWNVEAFDAIEAYLVEHEFFHVDEFWVWAGDVRGLGPGPSPRALGPAIRKAANAQMMDKTIVAMPSVRSHLSAKPVWRSRLYVGTPAYAFRGVDIP